MIEFKIADLPDQAFSTVLNNRRVSFRFRYNISIDRWSFDLSLDDVPILHARRVVVGTDLVAPFNFDIGRIFAVAIVDGSVPDRVNLPNSNVRIYQISDEEFAELAA